jgi:CRP-like cAMP-binding protein
MQEGFHEQLLQDLLVQAFGALDASSLALLREQLRWVEVAAGQTLMAQGEPGDALYLSVSGRLRAYVAGEDGTAHGARDGTRSGHRRAQPLHRCGAFRQRGGGARLGAGAPGQGPLPGAAGA